MSRTAIIVGRGKKGDTHLYARNGVREYWIIDIDERSVEVLVLS